MKDSPPEVRAFVGREIDKPLAFNRAGHDYRPSCLMCQKNIAIPHQHIPWPDDNSGGRR